MPEQALITQYFNRHNPISPNTSADATQVLLGIGDDAALITIPEHYELAISIDTLVTGVHFPPETAPEDIAYKALAVSLSDMAAMGARPETALLSLTIPTADKKWLKAFSDSLFELINIYRMRLIGGDTSRGPLLSITTVVNGLIPQGQAMRRSGARVGDALYVTGQLGDAGLGLQSGADPACRLRLNRPTPRVAFGIAIRDIASAAIDISDGLATDLEKLCAASGVGAQVNIDDVPRNKASIEMALTAGDDFELCFSVPPANDNKLETALIDLDCSYQKIGNITDKKTVHFLKKDGSSLKLKYKGYEHF